MRRRGYPKRRSFKMQKRRNKKYRSYRVSRGGLRL